MVFGNAPVWGESPLISFLVGRKTTASQEEETASKNTIIKFCNDHRRCTQCSTMERGPRHFAREENFLSPEDSLCREKFNRPRHAHTGSRGGPAEARPFSTILLAKPHVPSNTTHSRRPEALRNSRIPLPAPFRRSFFAGGGSIFSRNSQETP